MNRHFLFSLLLATSAIAPSGVFSQSAGIPELISPQTDGYMARAALFTDKELFEAVADQLQRIQTEGSTLTPEQRREWLFMLGNAYSRTGNPQCIALLDEYIEQYPTGIKTVEAKLAKADFLYFASDYPEALSEYNSLDFTRINPDLLPEATYRKAFCLIKCGFFDEARPLVASLENNREYSNAALFAEAYCDYMTGHYDTAFTKFSAVKKLAARNHYPQLCPDYYLAQILYKRGRYEEAAAMAREVLADYPANSLTSETLRVEGLSLFKADDTSAAFPVLKRYVEEEGKDAAPDAVYALASILFDRGDTASAAPLFERLADTEDAIGQGSLLALGQIAAKEGRESAAAIYFEKASRSGFDREVSRKALYNYVAARTQGGRVPFAPQIDLLERYIREYPNSDRTPEVREYLASAYFHEKDYLRALQSIEGIRNPSAKQKTAKQKILFELGTQALQNGQPSQAAGYLRQATALGNLDSGLLPEAWLWLGDALYAEKKYREAADAYSKATAGLKGTNKGLAVYGQAYSLFQTENFSKAAKLFSTAADDRNLPQRLRTDARLRLADCLYYTGDNAGARRLYSSLSAEGLSDTDYSAWRHAELTGVMGDNAGKIEELEKLRKTASSRWMPEILSSLGETYALTGNSEKADGIFTILLRDYPSSGNAPRAALALAQSYSKAGRDNQAKSRYLDILRSWPTSQEASVADQELRRIYASEGALKEYAKILNQIPGNFSLGKAEMEALSFEAAADSFNADMTDISRLESYLEDFPNGANATEAWYMLARGREEKGDLSGAFKAYSELERRADSEYLNEAYAGIMRTSADSAVKLKYARRVAEASGVGADERQEALLIQAEALSKSGKGQEAVAIWEELAASPASLSGAKAAVALGDHYLKTGNTAKAESTLTSFIDSGTPHSYWLARGYISLADTYTAMGKKFLARQFLESLRDNYPGSEDDIRKMINSRLSKM